MADSRHITRRAAFVGAAVSIAALAVPVAAAVSMPEPDDPDEVIRRHALDLAKALARKHGGMWSFDLFIERSADTKVVVFTRLPGPDGAMMLLK